MTIGAFSSLFQEVKMRINGAEVTRYVLAVRRAPEAGLWPLVVQLLLREAAGDETADRGEVSTSHSAFILKIPLLLPVSPLNLQNVRIDYFLNIF